MTVSVLPVELYPAARFVTFAGAVVSMLLTVMYAHSSRPAVSSAAAVNEPFALTVNVYAPFVSAVSAVPLEMTVAAEYEVPVMYATFFMLLPAAVLTLTVTVTFWFVAAVVLAAHAIESGLCSIMDGVIASLVTPVLLFPLVSIEYTVNVYDVPLVRVLI